MVKSVWIFSRLANGGYSRQVQPTPWHSAATCTGLVDEAKVDEWLNIDSNEPGHTTALTKEEIVQTSSRLDEKEDDKLMANKPVVPSHGVDNVCWSTSIR